MNMADCNGASPATDCAPRHGGDLADASRRYGIPLSDWLDLSTGINPDGYSIPPIPASCFQSLPQSGEELLAIAREYYAAPELLVAPGSQRLIELLPALRGSSRVAVPEVGYQEHAFQWRRQGHQVIFYDGFSPASLGDLLAMGNIDVAVVINPGNPTAARISAAQLRTWHAQLQARKGWLVVDEAFMDVIPDGSFASHCQLPGVIVLRSLGKFFGLAGLRIGFALVAQPLREQLRVALGPWPVAGPSLYVARCALADRSWQQSARLRLQHNSEWLQTQLLRQLGSHIDFLLSHPLFAAVQMEAARASALVEQLAQAGILVRYWPLPARCGDRALLRFGLISSENPQGRQRFLTSLAEAN